MRGHMFEITDCIDTIGEMKLEDIEQGSSVYCDSVRNVSQEGQAMAVSAVGMHLNRCGAVVESKLHESGENVIIFELNAFVRKRYFADRYNKFMQKVSKLNLDAFASDMAEIECLISEPYGDMIYYEGVPMNFEQFIRDAADGVYYIGNVIAMM